MTHERFDSILRERMSSMLCILKSKSKEYSVNGDRLHNFKVAARIMDTTPEKALMGMFMKHFVSITDMVEHPGMVSVDRIDEKLGDAINYLVLLEGLLLERLDASEQHTAAQMLGIKESAI